MNTKFYVFDQDNLGGTFDKELGYAVIVEAENAEDIISKED